MAIATWYTWSLLKNGHQIHPALKSVLHNFSGITFFHIFQWLQNSLLFGVFNLQKSMTKRCCTLPKNNIFSLQQCRVGRHFSFLVEMVPFWWKRFVHFGTGLRWPAAAAPSTRYRRCFARKTSATLSRSLRLDISRERKKEEKKTEWYFPFHSIFGIFLQGIGIFLEFWIFHSIFPDAWNAKPITITLNPRNLQHTPWRKGERPRQFPRQPQLWKESRLSLLG